MEVSTETYRASSITEHNKIRQWHKSCLQRHKFWIRCNSTQTMACWSYYLLLLLLFNLRVPFSSGKSKGVCTSQGGRFPAFSWQGKPPKRVSQGMTLCRVFRKNTCCDATQTYPASLNLRKLASTGEATQQCLHFWELLECSICDPTVGVRSGPPTLCASFCDNLFDACADAYFSMDAMTKVLTPCGVNDLVCGRASKWVRNGTELCQSAGLAVKDDYHLDETCYGGKASLDMISDSWKASRAVVPQKGSVLDEFQQWAAEMPFNERVSWAVGGMVLTAGLLFLSKRKSYKYAQKLAAIQQNARKVEMMNTRQRYFGEQGFNKATQR